MGGQRARMDGRKGDSEEDGVGEENADGSVTGYDQRTNERTSWLLSISLFCNYNPFLSLPSSTHKLRVAAKFMFWIIKKISHITFIRLGPKYFKHMFQAN